MTKKHDRIELTPDQQERMDVCMLRILQSAGYLTFALHSGRNSASVAKAVGVVADALADPAGLVADWIEHQVDFDRDRLVELLGEVAGSVAKAVAQSADYTPARSRAGYPPITAGLARQSVRELREAIDEIAAVLEKHKPSDADS